MAAFVVILAWTGFPIYWAINTSLMNVATADSRPSPLYPRFPTLSNYRNILGLTASNSLGTAVPHALLNSAIESLGATMLTIAVGALASYAMARLQFRFKGIVFGGILLALALPVYGRMIPVYVLINDLRLINTYVALMLVYASGFLPLASWILYNYFSSIPKELEEAAVLDGASQVGVLRRIMLPIAAPGIAAVAIITFLLSWGQFVMPLILTSDIGTQPLTVVISSLQGREFVPFTLINAGGIIAIAVPAVLTLTMSRYIVSGLLAGSLK